MERSARSQFLAFLLFVAPLQAACFASGAVEKPSGRPLGTLNLVSASSGTQSLAPTACASGERQVFLGVDFIDGRQGLAVRLIVGPEGTATVRVFATSKPLDPGVLFRRQDCGRFQVSLERTGWRINDIYDLRASLDVDCHTASGDSVAGTLAADHCH